MSRTTSRLAPAAVSLCLGIFLLALCAGVTVAGYSGPRVLGLLMRTAFCLLVGGIGALCLIWTVRELRGEGHQRRAVPAPLLLFCPACGESSRADDLWCAQCRLPLSARSTHWKSDALGHAALLFGLLLGGGLLFFGMFIATGPLLEGERRLWALVAFATLGLLVLAVGGAIVYGLARVARDELRGLRRFTYAWSAGEARQHVQVKATVTLRGQQIVKGGGTLSALLSPEAPARRHAALSPTARSFVRVLSFFHAHSLVALWREHRSTWTTGDEPLTRVVEDQLMCSVQLQRHPGDELRAPFELLLRTLPRTPNTAMTIPELWEQLARQPHAELSLRQCLRGATATSPHDERRPLIEAVLADQLSETIPG